MISFPMFYFECTPKAFEAYTVGMSEAMVKGFANALAHGMMPLYRNDHGVWMTRSDYLLKGSSEYYKEDRPKTSLVDNEGKWHYYAEFKP